MDLSHWYKKDVVLEWRRQRLSFAVSQSLFSSHDVDVGSRLLLRSLDVDALPERGAAVDYGCGYGILGLALKQVRPAWTIDLIDRDALAVAFSEWNAKRLGWDRASGVRCRVGLGVEAAPPEGVELLLWNVPGKAGQPVLQRLAMDAIGALATDGLLALVIVNPLAETLRAAIAADPSVFVEGDTAFADHTVIVARRTRPPSTDPALPGPPFARGVFDRERRTFQWDGLDYTMTPVLGLPEYDSRDHATDCALDLIAGLGGPVDHAVVQGVGQGHIPVVVHGTLCTRSMVLIDRDLLALEASARALLTAGVAPDAVATHARADLGPPQDGFSHMLVVMVLEDQQSPEVTAVQVRDLERMASRPFDLVVAGRSTSVTRFLGVAKRQPGWRVRTRRKRHGASAALLNVGPSVGP
ncbi:MAG TPA: methyltransferase [Thermomicrobiales bacterium]|nr:methyltransferase [Thermomicrobiales bacterium]